jgi:peptidoglycan/LPS O-acetylase OafA/YrhL
MCCFQFWSGSRRGLGSLLGLALVVSVVYQGIVFSRLGAVSVWNPVAATWYQALPGRCFEFVAGMCAAAVVARPTRDVTRLATMGASVCAVLALSYAYGIGMFGPLLHPMLGVWFSCLLVLSNRVSPHLFARRPILRALTWVGTMSYSLYLIHDVVFKVVRLDRVHIDAPSDALLIAFVFVRIALAVAVGYGFFLCFERPWIVRRKATEAEVIAATALSPAP